MASTEVQKKAVRRNVAIVFALFLLFNVALLALALAAAFGQAQPLALFPEETGVAVKIIVALLGAALSWGMGRWLYLQMLNGWLPADESATGAMVLMLYMVLFLVGAVFLGPALWLWQVVLLAVLLLLTLFGLRPVLGAVLAVVIIALCLAAGAVVYHVFA
ncbi:MAG: hypothetical protein NTY38_29510 [Acidobacteria bacterium]|nr:hypothetical protein [Acidobacteriota bacterium]